VPLGNNFRGAAAWWTKFR